MAFSGGTFNRLYSWVTDEANLIDPSSTRFDAEDDGFAAGLSTCLLKDGTQTVTANIPMAGFKFTGLGAGSALTDSATVGQIQSAVVAWVAAGGSADVITGTYAPAVTTLVEGYLLGVRAGAANATTTPTFSPNGLTARTIVKLNGAALLAGDIKGSGHDLLLRYDLANTRWMLLNPALPAGTKAQFDAGCSDDNFAYLGTNQSFTKAQGVTRVALADAATVAVDASLSNVFTLTLGDNRTLGQPTNPTDGQGITIKITQDGTGSRTLAYHADWLFPGGSDPVLSTAAGAVDVLSAVYWGDTTKWTAVLNKAFA